MILHEHVVATRIDHTYIQSRVSNFRKWNSNIRYGIINPDTSVFNKTFHKYLK